ncbi:MAG TPA: LppP/LprE family lipoprotein [Solirubrobacteraceae bacterium]|nr:LppP/LprE family lipoprotein [Solirubrobacteraceae bacterium]
MLAFAMSLTALLGGCGGATKTVSVAGSPTTSSTATVPTGTATQPTTSTATTGGASGGTPTTSTRTATAPAFAEQEKSATAEGLPAALAVVRAHGYTAKDTSDYHPGQTLRVLVGTGSHSNDGYDKQAFFFLDGHYIGTDASRPSAQIGVVSQNDTEVTLAYRLYRPNDPLCCPGGGEAHVRFQLNNGHLTPLDPIPPVSSTTGTSRQ